MYLCIGVLACLRWLKTRELADAVLALLMLAACPLLKVPGRIWAILALPALLVGLLPRRGPRIVGAGFAVAVLGLLLLAQTSPVIMGYQLHLTPRRIGSAGRELLPVRQLASPLVLRRRGRAVGRR
jgi:hypothetical protein